MILQMTNQRLERIQIEKLRLDSFFCFHKALHIYKPSTSGGFQLAKNRANNQGSWETAILFGFVQDEQIGLEKEAMWIFRSFRAGRLWQNNADLSASWRYFCAPIQVDSRSRYCV
jgi:hypothetical protein